MIRRIALHTLLIFLVAISEMVLAQPPEKMSYQAVIRDNSNKLVVNTNVGIQISILQSSVNGNAVFREVYNPAISTNGNGLITLEIGTGNASIGAFNEIDWSQGPYFVKSEVDPEGGTNYTITGISQLLSVPYALFSKSAETITGEISENDPIFEGSIAAGITGNDTSKWNNKLDNYIETQSLSDVAAIDNNVNTQLKNLADPTEAQDAATKAYVDALEERIRNLEVKDSLDNLLFTDSRDGKVYKSTTIGTQTWMSENLAYLPEVHSNAEFKVQKDDELPGYAVYGYDGSNVSVAKSKENFKTYGVLYNWYAVTEVEICPDGWHVPSEGEWQTLEEYLISDDIPEANTGVALQAISEYWKDQGEHDFRKDKYGFSALPGGGRYTSRATDDMDIGEGETSVWWSSTERDDGTELFGYKFFIYYADGDLFQEHEWKPYGLSVRCIKN